MGNTRKQAELSLLAKVDEQVVRRSIQHLRELQAAEQSVTTAAGRQEIAIDEVSDATRRNINAVRQNITVARQENLNRQRALKDLDQEARARLDVAQAAERQATSTARASRSTGRGTVPGVSRSQAAGDVSTGLSALSSVAGSGPLGSALRVGSDITGAAEQLPRLIDGLRGLAGASTVAGTAASSAGPAVAATGIGLGALAASAALAALAVAGVAVAYNDMRAKVDAGKESLQRTIDQQVEYQVLIRTGSKEAIESEREKLQVQIEANQLILSQLQAGYERLGIFAKAFDFLAGKGSSADQIKTLTARIGEFEDASYRLDLALESEEVKARSAATAIEEQATQTQQVAHVVQDATRAETERTQAIRQSTQAVIDANQQVRQLQMGYPQQLAEIRKSYEDEFQAFAERAADLQKDAESRRFEIIRDANRDIEREQRRSALDQMIADARFKMDTFELGVDRDFAGLANLRREKAFDDQARAAEEQFNMQERAIGVQQQIEDARVSAGQQLIDLERQRATIVAAMAQAEADAKRKLIEELLRARGLNPTPSTTPNSSGGMRYLASGGYLPAGQSAIVNEGFLGQRESFNTGGRSMMLPSGMGIFTPFKSGQVTNNSGGNTVNITVVGSRDPASTAREVRRQVDDYFSTLIR
jgi:hypothetical protein